MKSPVTYYYIEKTKRKTWRSPQELEWLRILYLAVCVPLVVLPDPLPRSGEVTSLPENSFRVRTWDVVWFSTNGVVSRSIPLRLLYLLVSNEVLFIKYDYIVRPYVTQGLPGARASSGTDSVWQQRCHRASRTPETFDWSGKYDKLYCFIEVNWCLFADFLGFS